MKEQFLLKSKFDIRIKYKKNEDNYQLYKTALIELSKINNGNIDLISLEVPHNNVSFFDDHELYEDTVQVQLALIVNSKSFSDATNMFLDDLKKNNLKVCIQKIEGDKYWDGII